MKKPVATTILLMFHAVLLGQAFDTEFAPSERWEEPREIISDEHIFYTPAWNAPDPFRDLSRYRFGAVRYRERGLDDRFRRITIDGTDLSDNISGTRDYTLSSLLWRTSLPREYIPAFVAGDSHAGGPGYSENYRTDISRLPDEVYVSGRAADRSYRAGADLRYKTSFRKGWHGAVGFSGRWGPDGHIPGVRTNNTGAVLSATRKWSDDHSLSLFAAGNHSLQGLRSAASGEAFSLTGDRLYNPSWGWQNGRVRNSCERRNRGYLALAVYRVPLGKERILTASAGFRWGRGGYSALAWYNTHSPMPDYYRKMPSWFPDWSAKGVISEAWRQHDPSVTQVDWDELCYVNTLTGGHATYLVEERIERVGNASASVRIDRRLGAGLDLTYGVDLRRDRSRCFKEARDMLGGGFVYNIDQYVTDFDGEYRVGAGNDNDLRDPGRQVGEGDRFGYDYAITRFAPGLFGTIRWDKAGYGLTASASVHHTRLRREGFYEKELFPGDDSFGLSPTVAFTTGTVSAAAYWNVSVRHRLSASALASSEAPFAHDVFISPQQNNFTVTSPRPAAIYGAEVSWSFAGKDLDLRVTGFVNASTGETEVRSYYDDLSSVFSNMVVRGIDKLGYGIEAGIEARFTRWLSLRAGASVGSYRYNSEPLADIYADIDNSPVAEGVVCYMSGLKTGPPQMVASAELTYSDRRRWRVSLSAGYMGDRHVAINPLYHSSRVTGINPAPEIMRLFTTQERLPDAFTLGVSLSKGFVLKRGYLRLSASVHNILGSEIIYSGYEQMRIMRSGSGITRTLLPFPTKYLWGYPATWNFTVSYRL